MHLNEDACYFAGSSASVTLAAIDGAGARAEAVQMQRLFGRYGKGSTAARFAAQLTREVIARQPPEADPAEVLLAANAALRAELESVYGALSAEALLRAEPHLTFIQDDPRLVRLPLPVCVVTLVRVDLQNHCLHYAHAGDTALLLFRRGGAVWRVTHDRVEPHDRDALAHAQALRARRQVAHLTDMLGHNEVTARNRAGGLYHNYVDEAGQTDPRIGIGVINGLPALADYIQRGTVDLADVEGVLLCSDGFLWPAPLEESEAARAARLEGMRARIRRDGLRGYLRALRAVERADAARNLFPRFKVHDDATAVYLKMRSVMR